MGKRVTRERLNEYFAAQGSVFRDILKTLDQTAASIPHFDELGGEVQDRLLSEPFVDQRVQDIEYDEEHWGSMIVSCATAHCA